MKDDGKPDFEEVLIPNGDGSTHGGIRINPRVWHRLAMIAAMQVFLAAVMKAERWAKEPQEGVESAAEATIGMADALLAAMEQPLDAGGQAG